MKKILLIFGILLAQTLYAADYIQSYPLTYSILSQEDLTVEVVGVNQNYNETTLTIPAQIQYNEQTYTVIAIGNLNLRSLKSKTIEIPATVEEYSISNTSSNLAYIAVDEANPVFASVDGILYTKNLDTLIKCPPKRENEVKMPEGVKIIKEDAFHYCEKLENIMLPSSLEEIGNNSFDSCTSLETIILPNSVSKVGSFAFANCSALKSIKLSDSLEIVELLMFMNCTALESIEISSSVREIKPRAFDYCINLESIFIPAKLEKLDGAFADCPKLTNIIIDDENPYLCAENGIIFNKDKTILVSYPSASGAVEVQDGITEIGHAAFLDCGGALTKITLPASIEKIGSSSFYNCYDLNTLIIYAPNPPYLDQSAFTGGVSPLPNPDIFVPAESLELYKNATYWKSRKDKIFSIEGTSDIRDLTDDNDSIYEVFSIQGVHILTTTNKDDIHCIPTGLYIINGKKFFLHN